MKNPDIKKLALSVGVKNWRRTKVSTWAEALLAYTSTRFHEEERITAGRVCLRLSQSFYEAWEVFVSVDRFSKLHRPAGRKCLKLATTPAEARKVGQASRDPVMQEEAEVVRAKLVTTVDEGWDAYFEAKTERGKKEADKKILKLLNLQLDQETEWGKVCALIFNPVSSTFRLKAAKKAVGLSDTPERAVFVLHLVLNNEENMTEKVREAVKKKCLALNKAGKK